MKAPRPGGVARLRRGASAVEFGLTLPIVFLLLSLVLDVGWFLSRQHIAHQAARDAVRWSVRSSDDPAVVAWIAEANAASWLEAMNIECGEGCVIDADPVSIGGFNGIELTLAVEIQPMLGFVMPSQVVRARYTMLLDRQS